MDQVITTGIVNVTDSLYSTQTSYSFTTNITIDIASLRSTSSNGQSCMVTVFDNNDPRKCATAITFISNRGGQENGAIACLQLYGLDYTLESALISGQRYGLKISAIGSHNVGVRYLFF